MNLVATEQREGEGESYSWHHRYDRQGKISRDYDEFGQESLTVYNPFGQEIKEVSPTVFDAEGRRWIRPEKECGYDPLGRLI